MTFNRIDAMAKLLQTLARIDIPDQHDLAAETADQMLNRAIDDADALYKLIDEARDILRS